MECSAARHFVVAVLEGLLPKRLNRKPSVRRPRSASEIWSPILSHLRSSAPIWGQTPRIYHSVPPSSSCMVPLRYLCVLLLLSPPNCSAPRVGTLHSCGRFG